MQSFRFLALALLITFVSVAAPGLSGAQPPRFPFPLEPAGSSGEAMYGALEGWYRNDDGSMTILLGYYNRNEHAIEIPIGADNRIEPGGPDHGQPTHFEPGRSWGVFTVTVPQDFGDQRFTWTLNANSQQTEISFWLNPAYFVDPFLNHANENAPPFLTVVEGGATLQGPVRGSAGTITSTAGEPVTLHAWARDVELHEEEGGGGGGRRRAPLSVTWTAYRGTGEVTFEEATHEFETVEGGEATTTATFSEPGEYRLLVTANDVSGVGGGAEQCCWTSTYVDVTVVAP